MKLAIIAFATAVLLAVVFYVSPAFLPPMQDEDVAAPADDARPVEVVRTYLAALNAHDCDRASSLVMTREGAPGDATGWCHRVASLDDVEIGEPSLEDPEWSGHTSDEQVVRVPTSFTLTSRRLRKDVSLPDGATVWGYTLALDPAGRWRIFDQGAV